MTKPCPRRFKPISNGDLHGFYSLRLTLFSQMSRTKFSVSLSLSFSLCSIFSPHFHFSFDVDTSAWNWVAQRRANDASGENRPTIWERQMSVSDTFVYRNWGVIIVSICQCAVSSGDQMVRAERIESTTNDSGEGKDIFLFLVRPRTNTRRKRVERPCSSQWVCLSIENWFLTVKTFSWKSAFLLLRLLPFLSVLAWRR